MSGFARASEVLALCATLFWGGAAAAADRVVSVNLCTDQLALAVADPDQIVALSPMAHEGVASIYADRAAGIPTVAARAEAVYLLKPDIVVAGTFTSRATVDMMRRVGLNVAEFPPATSMDDIAANLRRMGDLLGREAAADAAIGALDTEAMTMTPGPRAALYGPNGWLQGRSSLAGEIVARAGFANVASDTGLTWGGFLPLETLVMAEPDVLIVGQGNPGHSEGDALLHHPALDAIATRASLIDSDWVCGTPAVVGAIARLATLRTDLAR